MHRILDLIRNPSYSRTTSLLVIVIIALSIPLTVFVAQKQQEIRQRAAFEEETGITQTEGTKICTTTTVKKCLNPGQVLNYPSSASDCSLSEDTSSCDFLIIPGRWYDCKAQTCTTTTTTSPSLLPGSQTLQDTCTTQGGTCVTNEKTQCEGKICTPGSGTCAGGVCYKISELSPTCDPKTEIHTKCNLDCTLPSNCGKKVICETSCGRTGVEGQCHACTPGETPPPATPAPATSAPSVGGPAISCPGTGIPSAPHDANIPGGKEEWGGSCSPELQDRAIAIPGTCNCTVAVCKRYSGGPLCWVNNGQTYGQVNNDVAGCNAKGAQLPSSCLVSPPPTPNLISCSTTPTCPAGHDVLNWQGTGRFTCIKRAGEGGYADAVCPTGGTQLAFTIGLDGIGTTGDRQNPSSSGSNKNPRRTARKLFYQVFDPSVNLVAENKSPVDITYDSQSGKFKTTVDLGKNLPSGNYIAKVRTQGYLAKVVRRQTSFPTPEAAITVTGQTAEVPPINLFTGDIDASNKIDILDYNLLLGCIFKAFTANCENSDLDDNGTVNEFDYNLLLREFPAGQGE